MSHSYFVLALFSILLGGCGIGEALHKHIAGKVNGGLKKRIDELRSSFFPDDLELNIVLVVTTLFRRKFVADEKDKVAEIVKLAQEKFLLESSPMKLSLKVVSTTYYDAEILPSKSEKEVAQHVTTIPEEAHLYAYLTVSNGNDLGNSELGHVCSPEKKYRAMIVAYDKSLDATSWYLAHEIGHQLGMHHDFTITTGPNDPIAFGDRFDSEGKACRGISAAMDYVGTGDRDKWSTCSREDAEAHFRDVWDREGEFCLSNSKWRPSPRFETCNDTQVICPYWKEVGACKTYPENMKLYCAKTCGFCEPTGCWDRSESCHFWTSRFFNRESLCTGIPETMKKWCPKSCGFCSTPEPEGCEDTDTDLCQKRTNQGNRSSCHGLRYDIFATNCRKTCGFCETHA